MSGMRKIFILLSAAFFVLNFKFFESASGNLKWFGKMPMISYQIGVELIEELSLQSSQGKNQIVESVKKGADAWSAAGAPAMALAYPASTGSSLDLEQSDFNCSTESKAKIKNSLNTVRLSAENSPDCTGAVCSAIWSCEAEILNFDIVFNRNQLVDNLKDLTSLVSQSFGHAIGLNHCAIGAPNGECLNSNGEPSEESVMHRFFRNFSEDEFALAQDDTDGVKALYPNLKMPFNELRNRETSYVYPATGLANQSGEYSFPKGHFLYQLNPELFKRLGDFFTPENTALSTLHEITDVAMMVAAPEIRPDWFQSVDSNHFILDGHSGTIFYSFARNLSFTSNPEFKGATKIAVDSYGRIALLDSSGYLNMCWRFTGWNLQRDSGCNSVFVSNSALLLTDYLPGEFLIGYSNGNVVSIAIDESQKSINFPFNVSDLVSVWADESLFVITDRSGNRISVVSNNQDIIAQAENTVFDLGLGPVNGPTELRFVTPISGGGYIGVSVLYNALILFDSELNYQGTMTPPPMPYPFRYMKYIKGLAVNLSGGLLSVWSGVGVNVFVIGETEIYDFLWLIPDMYVADTFSPDAVVDEAIASLKSNPRQNLLDLPEIQNMIKLERELRE